MGRCQKTFHNPDKCYLFLIEVFIDEGEWISLPEKIDFSLWNISDISSDNWRSLSNEKQIFS